MWRERWAEPLANYKVGGGIQIPHSANKRNRCIPVYIRKIIIS